MPTTWNTRKPVKVDDTDLYMMVRWYWGGATLLRISEAADIDKSGVWYHLRKTGIKLRPVGRSRQATIVKTEYMRGYEAGYKAGLLNKEKGRRQK